MAVRTLEAFDVPAPEAKIWRYIDLAKFQLLLKSSAVYFASAREFEDKFEGSITKAEMDWRRRWANVQYVSKAFEELRRLTKISCWHLNEGESAAMWKLYLKDSKGIAIQSTVGRLLNSLTPYRIQPDYGEEDFWIGTVKYVDYRKEVLADKSMLGRFFSKRASFSHEREFRVAVSLRSAEEFAVAVPEKGILVGVDLPKLVENIYLAPGLGHEFRNEIHSLIKQAKIDSPIGQSEFDDDALY